MLQDNRTLYYQPIDSGIEVKETKYIQITGTRWSPFSCPTRIGELTTDWTTANVSAIHKTGNKNQAHNYRPVSLTSIAGKILVLQLLKVLHSWTETLENGGCIDVVYCDFMKAFDKVPHRRLIGKLQSCGIKGNILDWVAAMLSHRSQRVRVNNTFSSWPVVYHKDQ